jgi:hypothetical protein
MEAPIYFLKKGHVTIWGSDQTGLPLWIFVSENERFTPNRNLQKLSVGKEVPTLSMENPLECYSMAIPMQEDYMAHYDAALRLVYLHPKLCSVQVNQKNGIGVAVFPGVSGKTSLEMVFSLHSLCRVSKYLDMEICRMVEIPSYLSIKMKAFKRKMPTNKISNGWALSGTSASGNAWGETSATTVLRLCIIRTLFGLGIEQPGSVLADIGSGLGAAIFPASVFSARTKFIGIEKEGYLHERFVFMHQHLLKKEHECNIASRHIDANDMELQGITHAQLFDGHAPTIQEKIPTGPKSHLNLIKSLMNTASVNEITSTKLNRSALARYGEMDATIQSKSTQFFLVNYDRARYKTETYKTSMWLRKKEFRQARPAGSHTAKIGSIICSLIQAADYKQQTSDEFGRVVLAFPDENAKENPITIRDVRDAMTGTTTSVYIFSGAVRYFLTGEEFFPGTAIEYECPTSGEYVLGTFAGILLLDVSDEASSREIDPDLLLVVTQDKSTALIVHKSTLGRPHAESGHTFSAEEMREFTRTLPLDSHQCNLQPDLRSSVRRPHAESGHTNKRRRTRSEIKRGVEAAAEAN